MGKGAAVIPAEGKVYAPVDGVAVSVFDTKHAIGIAAENGAEILIHIGLDTVELNGKYFTAHISQGDAVKKGQLLMEFDMEGIRAAGYDVVTPVIISNTDQYLDVLAFAKGEVDTNDTLITILS